MSARVVAIGDIGVVDGMLHVGDEAMFDELVANLRRRGIESITAVSSAPADSAARYDLDAILPIGFGGLDADARADRRDRVLRSARGESGALPADDPARAVIAALESADALAIAGGGNLASVWPLHVWERATLAALAEHFGLPVVVSGQTLGPVLHGAERDLVADLVRGARLVGLREDDSFTLARQLGAPSPARTPDDASFLPDRYAAVAASAPYALVTLARHVGDHDRDAALARLADLLDTVHESTGLEVLFSAHFGALPAGSVPPAPRGDDAMHEEVRTLMRTPSRVERLESVARSAALARGASLVVSSRYHPAVFAVSGGVPTIGVAVDEYTTTKLRGTLGTFDQHTVQHLGTLDAGVVDRVWTERSAIRERGLEAAARRRAEASQWWDRVVSAVAEPR